MLQRSYFWHQAQVCMSLARVTDDPVLKEQYEDLAVNFVQNAGRERDLDGKQTSALGRTKEIDWPRAPAAVLLSASAARFCNSESLASQSRRSAKSVSSSRLGLFHDRPLAIRKQSAAFSLKLAAS